MKSILKSSVLGLALAAAFSHSAIASDLVVTFDDLNPDK